MDRNCSAVRLRRSVFGAAVAVEDAARVVVMR
jgi:hypothetical protein